MNKALAAVMCAGLALSAIAQTVKVIPLSPDEAREAKAIAEAREALDVRDKNLRDKIGNTHLKAGQLEQACNGIKGGWGCTLDFEFSDDYKYIVPAKPPATVTPNFGIQQWAPANQYPNPVYGPANTCITCVLDGTTTLSHPIAAQKTQDDGFGKCPAFSHFHKKFDLDTYDPSKTYPPGPAQDANKGMRPADNLCHDDITDAPITDRPKLPKPAPQFKPGKEPVA